MKSHLKMASVALGVVFAALLCTPVAQAQANNLPCPGFGIVDAHLLGSYWSGLPEGYLSGRAWSIAQPGIAHSGTAPFICPDSATLTSGGQCPPEAGSASDGRVTVLGNWGNPLVAGCPDPSLADSGQNGDDPVGNLAISSLGEGLTSHAGVHVLAGVGFSVAFGGYVVDMAHPFSAGGLALPVGASLVPTPSATAITSIGGGLSQIDLEWSAATVLDDCPQNPFGTCPSDGPLPLLEGYAVHQQFLPCTSEPTTSDRAFWGAPFVTTGPTVTSVSTVVPDVLFSDPLCVYFAVGLVAGGEEGAMVSGHTSCGDVDLDLDGVIDCLDNCPAASNPPSDCDLDPGTPDEQCDADGDGLGDACDVCPFDVNPGQEDSDADGAGDVCDNCPSDSNAGQADADGDGVGDVCDSCPNDANPGQEDSDGDGHGDACDNCPAVANANQADADGDGFGNACDNCPSDANANQADGDGDGIGDVCDNCPADFNPGQSDVDFDGWGDDCDVCPLIPNPSQDPLDCEQRATDISILTLTNSSGGGTLAWTTTTEIDVISFNVIRVKKGEREQLNPLPIPCQTCFSGLGASYSYYVGKHKGGQFQYFVELRRFDGTVEVYGPAETINPAGN